MGVSPRKRRSSRSAPRHGGQARAQPSILSPLRAGRASRTAAAVPAWGRSASPGTWRRYSGDLYERRRGDFPEPLRRRVLLLYFVCPPGLIYLLRTMVPREMQAAAPLVTLYAFGVYAIFFWVPIKISLRRLPK